jgi:hypothetical protein
MAGKRDNGSNETNFHGPVTGAVHTGSGDINIGTFVAGGAISTKEDFLSALRTFKAEIDTA